MTGRDRPRVDPGNITLYTLVLNYLPIAYLAAGVAVTWATRHAMSPWGVALGWIYLVPPVTCRLVIAIFGPPLGRGLRQDSRPYRVWWFVSQMQVVFNRLPWLEEMLRLVPGMYAAWLNLWGSRVSPFAYWGPGSRVLDRNLIRVERGVVVGAQSAITGHLATLSDGEFVVDVETVVVERGAIVGARAGLGPGCRVAAGQLVTAGRLLQPFSIWDGGRKFRERAPR